MGIFTYNYKIKYSDVNKNNTITLKSLVACMQEAAEDNLEQIGFGINNSNITKVSWMLLNWKVKVNFYPNYNEILTINTWPRIFSGYFSYRDFEIFDSSHNLVAIASSKWALVDLETHKLTKINEDIIKAHSGTILKSVFEEPINEKLCIPINTSLAFSYKILRRDIDTNNHVNNLNYIDFALECLSDNIYNTNFHNLEISYKKEIKPNENINCFYSYLNNCNTICIKNNDNSILHSVIKLY